MDASRLNQTIDLPALVGWRDTGRTWQAGPCPFCGGRDRFVLKRTAQGWRWYCRGCGDGRYHSALDFIMKRDGLDFKGAVKALGGDVQMHPAHPVHQVHPVSIPPAP